MTSSTAEVPVRIKPVETGAVLGQTMGLVALTTGLFALGAFLGRNTSGGWAIAWFVAALAILVSLNVVAQRSELLAVGLLFGFGSSSSMATSPAPGRRANDMSNATCSHLDQIEIRELPESVDGCEDCLRIGGKWLHLRICLTCGHVGCCDDSPNRHASAHAASHPIIRSLEPGEEWSWCYVDEVAFLVGAIRGKTRISPSSLNQ